MKGVLKSMIYCILCKGEVWVNKKCIKFEYKFEVGDEVCILLVCVVEWEEEVVLLHL